MFTHICMHAQRTEVEKKSDKFIVEDSFISSSDKFIVEDNFTSGLYITITYLQCSWIPRDRMRVPTEIWRARIGFIIQAFIGQDLPWRPLRYRARGLVYTSSWPQL